VFLKEGSHETVINHYESLNNTYFAAANKTSITDYNLSQGSSQLQVAKVHSFPTGTEILALKFLSDNQKNYMSVLTRNGGEVSQSYSLTFIDESTTGDRQFEWK